VQASGRMAGPRQSAAMSLPSLTTTELVLAALLIVFALPWGLWRLLRRDDWAPLVVVQIFSGILLGPGVLGQALPELHRALFTPAVVQSLSALALWGVCVFVWLAGIELDLRKAWQERRDSGVTAGLALVMPLLLGAGVGAAMLAGWIGLPGGTGWLGANGQPWQFVLGLGMACAVTALPILVLFLERLGILRDALGQRVLRYASLDDVAVWAVLALILLDWVRVGRQLAFLLLFVLAAWGLRVLTRRLAEADRWPLGLVWLLACALAADWAGLHYIVGAFLAGAVLEREWFDEAQLDRLRHHVLLLLMPVFFLSTGLRTQWQLGGGAVLLGALALLAAAVAGKLLGVGLAGRVLGWPRGHALVVGWLLQTKALIMIIFASILLDRQVISADTFTALLLMALLSTMLTMPMVAPRLARLAAARGPEA
jgi:Kef-type K+ transport system membrane component KefB